MTPLLGNSITSSLTIAYVISPSLGNFFSSLIAGAVVLLAIGGALAFISQNDKVTRS
uniref:Photosystem II reaction center protein X n=1 Tax=Haslea nusantara TaxID=2600302 RepID=A0A5B8H9M4_9STRA|nr:X 4.1 kDa protein of photosystem II [Haslea nusantara]QDX17493.1 X 4.1 kDa protein of photosystem II [Haslea nusantara]